MSEPTPQDAEAAIERSLGLIWKVTAIVLALVLAGVVAVLVVVGLILSDIHDVQVTNCRGVAILEEATGPEAQERGRQATGAAVGAIVDGIASKIDAAHGLPTTTRPAPATTSTTTGFAPDFERCE